MELGQQISEREPIMFDRANLPEGFRGEEEGMLAAFKFNRVAFEDDLQTCVAMSYGISESGELDMSMLVAVEQAAEYLERHQGQPVVIANMHTDNSPEGKLTSVNGHIATLADGPNLVGLHERADTSQKHPGIAVKDSYSSFDSYTANGELNTQYLRPNSSPVIPLSSPELTLGRPGDSKFSHDEQEVRQEVVAGEDIVPWIIKTFGSDENGYHVYMNIVKSVTSGEGVEFAQLESLLQEPFVGMAAAEQAMLRDTREVIANYEFKKTNTVRMLEGFKGEANLALSGIEAAHPGFRNRIPRTNSSYPADVTSSLDDPYGEQIEGRMKAIDHHQAPLDKLLNEARRQGKVINTTKETPS